MNLLCCGNGVLCLQQRLQQRNPSRGDSFLKNEEIQSVFHKALLSVQPSSAEVLPETVIKAWTRRFLTIAQSTGHVQVKKKGRS